jgi:hypothetical protein
MTRKLRPSERASAVRPLTAKQREFVDIHLARGASPKAIRQVMNNLAKMTRDEIQVKVRAPRQLLVRNREPRDWLDLAGAPQVALVQVRRELDRLRKAPGGLDASRKDQLHAQKMARLRDKELAKVTGIKYPAPRKLHDLGFARRFGASQEMLDDIADRMTIPEYLDVE